MTLELNQVAPQVKAMGQSLDKQITAHHAAAVEARQFLRQFSTEFSALTERITLAEKVQTEQRFAWVGAAPTAEALAQAYPLPSCPDRVTVIASDGSQILPDRHAILSYYLINVGGIIYHHGANIKPEIFKRPTLFYEAEDISDEQDQLISASEVNVKRDLAELEILTDLAAQNAHNSSETIITLIDGRLTLRVIDLPFDQQQKCQDDYIERLNRLREVGAAIAGYIDRPRSTFVVALMRLAALEPEAITEDTLRHNPFRHLTDTDLFDFLGPGQRSAIFAFRAKGTEKYDYAGHGIHFFYLNVSLNPALSNLVRVEIPAWLMADRHLFDALHAAIVRQASLTGGYPYVLARAHELAIISGEEREAFEMMLAVEMRRRGLNPTVSAKQFNKNLLTGRESFRL
jgi:NurA-like 5'-3' nuclease